MTEEWLTAAGAEGSGITGPPTLSASFLVEVSGGAAGDRIAHVVFAGGRLVEIGSGSVPSPDVTLTLSDSDAQAVLAGELDLAVAFMQGRMKVAGAMAPLLDLLALAATADGRARRTRLHGLTNR